MFFFILTFFINKKETKIYFINLHNKQRKRRSSMMSTCAGLTAVTVATSNNPPISSLRWPTDRPTPTPAGSRRYLDPTNWCFCDQVSVLFFSVCVSAMRKYRTEFQMSVEFHFIICKLWFDFMLVSISFFGFYYQCCFCSSSSELWFLFVCCPVQKFNRKTTNFVIFKINKYIYESKFFLKKFTKYDLTLLVAVIIW